MKGRVARYLATMVCISMPVFSASAQELAQGRLLPHIQAVADTTQSYALYLPSSYTPSRQWPVIYVFDPAARGALAASKFRYAAEKYGYIVAASNNSRNGDWSIVIDAMEAMSEDTQKRFSIDGKRRYSSGFSGGARSAVYMALKTGDIAGVIACGAGFPQVVGGPASPTFDFAGLVGNRDANYYELSLVHEELTNLPGKELLITFDGGHQWPDSALIGQGVAWLELQAMRRGLLPVDPGFVADYKQLRMGEIEKEENPAQRYFLVRQLHQSLRGLSEVADLEEDLERLQESREVKQALQQREKIQALEGELWRKYGEALSSMPATSAAPDSADANRKYASEKWWRKELASIQDQSRQLGEQEGALFYERIKSFIWITAIESFERAWRTDRLDQAAPYLQVASVVRPASPEPFFYLAKVYSKQHKYRLAMRSLEEAAQRGMSRYELITEEELFDPLKKRKGFEELVNKIKQQRD